MRLKNPVLILLGALVLSSAFVASFILWRANSAVPDTNALSRATNVTPADADIVKEKLDSYSKRADDLQKLLSLLLTLTTIYTVALALSAYTSVQNNLRESEKGIERLDRLVAEQERIIQESRDVIPKQIEELQRQTAYTRRIAVATAISQLPLRPERYREVQETFVKHLMEMRSGYATDPMLNQQLARLYVALERYRDAEEVMTAFIRRKREQGERHDDAIADAYYDRACYQALQWSGANREKKADLVSGIKRDLTRAFRLNNALRDEAKKDPELKDVAGESWFETIVR